MVPPLVEKTIQDALLMLEEGRSKQCILTHLIDTAEILAGNDAVSSILVLDKDGLLRNGSSPKLPKDYIRAIDGLKPDPNVGTCAAAAATGSVVFTSDFQADDKWAELRHLPQALGFVGAWSMPITTPEGDVLGTFGTYYRDKRHPSEEEIDGIRLLASAAAKVLNSGN